MYDWLDEIADDVVLAHPTKVRAIAEARIKNDRLDSETLAQLLRVDLIPTAYAPSKEVRAVKRVLRQRMFFVRVQTMVKNRIHALLTQHAIELPDVTDLYGKAGLAWLHQLTLPEPDGQLLRDDLSLLATLRERIIATDRLIARLAQGDEIVIWLASLPGIGPFFAALLRYEVDDMRRFRSAKKFACYTGLIPSTYASNTRIYHGPLTKQGNRWLRWAFIEAVAPALRVSSELRRYYDQIKARRGAHDARVCTARKLAELAWTVWTERRCYEDRPARSSEKLRLLEQLALLDDQIADFEDQIRDLFTTTPALERLRTFEVGLHGGGGGVLPASRAAVLEATARQSSLCASVRAQRACYSHWRRCPASSGVDVLDSDQGGFVPGTQTQDRRVHEGVSAALS